MKLPIGITPKATLIENSLLEEILLQEAKDNGFETRRQFVLWKLNKDLSKIPLNFVDVKYNKE